MGKPYAKEGYRPSYSIKAGDAQARVGVALLSQLQQLALLGIAVQATCSTLSGFLLV